MDKKERESYQRFAPKCRTTCKPLKGCKQRKEKGMTWNKLEKTCPKKKKK